MNFSDPKLIIGLAVLGFIVIAVIVLFWDDGESDVVNRRAKALTTPTANANPSDARSVLRKKNQELIEGLRSEDDSKRKIMLSKDIETLLERTGAPITPAMFWVGSMACGAVLAVLVLMSGFDGVEVTGVPFLTNPVLALMIGFIGFYSLPRVFINTLAKRRFALMTRQFGDAIDMIVRGVKSGLPLNDCLRLISNESPAPMSIEFGHICDDLKMGTTVDKALAKLFKRVPLPEINFFVIVLTIQQKSGGNLSEALGNLSGVIRTRRLMREKVKALASEAIASASIIGCLPVAVGGMVYMTSPDYIMLLFTDPTGNFFLLFGVVMMSMGIFVMKRMMNFEI